MAPIRSTGRSPGPRRAITATRAPVAAAARASRFTLGSAGKCEWTRWTIAIGCGGCDTVQKVSATSLVRTDPRVLVVTNMYPMPEDPAYGAFVATQVESLSRAGAEVQVEFVNGRQSATAYLGALLSVNRLARSGKFQVVHAHYGLTGFVAAFQRLPLVVTFHGDDLLGTPNGHGGVTLKSRLIRRLGHVAARRADAVICQSDAMRHTLPQVVDGSRAHVIPMGVDVERFSPGDRAAARARL